MRSESDFPRALREAIAGAGCSLSELAEAVRQQGLTVTPATLSYWQRGVRHPSGPSVPVVSALEEALGLAPGLLVAATGRSDVRAGRLGPSTVTPAIRALANVRQRWGLPWDDGLSRELIVARVEPHPDGQGRQRRWMYVRAHRPAAHGLVVASPLAAGAPPGTPAVRPLRGCRIGRTAPVPEHPAVVTEVLLERPLRHGEASILEFDITGPGFSAPGTVEVRTVHPVQVLVVQVVFQPAAVPTRAWQRWSPSVEQPQSVTERELALPTSTPVLQAVAAQVHTGLFGVRWEHTDEPGLSAARA